MITSGEWLIIGGYCAMSLLVGWLIGIFSVKTDTMMWNEGYMKGRADEAAGNAHQRTLARNAAKSEEQEVAEGKS